MNTTCSLCDVVERNLIIISKFNKMFKRDCLKTALISGIDCLLNAEIGRNIGLSFISILS